MDKNYKDILEIFGGSGKKLEVLGQVRIKNVGPLLSSAPLGSVETIALDSIETDKRNEEENENADDEVGVEDEFYNYCPLMDHSPNGS